MFAGHDTTATAVSWMLYNMARHPEHQQKCRDEIDELMDKKGKDEIEWYVSFRLLPSPAAVKSKRGKKSLVLMLMAQKTLQNIKTY